MSTYAAILVLQLSILITSVLNSVSCRLFFFILIHFFWSFVLLFYLGHVSLSPNFGSLSVSMY